ncbi:MAG: hypothetical protein ACKVUS_03925 [Saprospiraceae bacterium]
MTATLEHRKRSIFLYLAELENEAIIVQIENLLKPAVDFWDELTESQQATIRLGVRQLDEGNFIDYQEFIANYRRTHS